MADYLGDKHQLTRKLDQKFRDNPELIVEFIKEENGFYLELMPLEEEWACLAHEVIMIVLKAFHELGNVLGDQFQNLRNVIHGTQVIH